jgi:hypothetical protein
MIFRLQQTVGPILGLTSYNVIAKVTNENGVEPTDAIIARGFWATTDKFVLLLYQPLRAEQPEEIRIGSYPSIRTALEDLEWNLKYTRWSIDPAIDQYVGMTRGTPGS